MDWTSKQQSQLEQIITTGLQHVGTAVFVESQRRVPVVTGNLKSSGSITFPSDGFEITYTAPYANNVEVGSSGSAGAEQSQPWKQKVPAHIRRTKNGRVRVAAHTKTYASGKPVQMPDGNWRVSKTTTSRGRHFVRGSLKSLLTGTFSTTSGFQKYLQTDTI